MSRYIRKVEGEDFFIIYCNIDDMLWAGMYENVITAKTLIELQGHISTEKFNEIYYKITIIQGIISLDKLNEIIDEVLK